LALLWLVFALLFQGFAIKTHAHFGAGRMLATAGPARVTTAAADSQRRSPTTPPCQLCEEKALFGAYLLTGSVTFAKPVDVPTGYATASLPLLGLHLSSHAWQSRAPPSSTI
jgi:hypothetical protein